MDERITAVHQLFVPLFVSNVLFGNMFLHPYFDFFHLSSIVILVWLYSQCMMCNFVSVCFIFLGLGGHDCRSPRKPHEARMQQRSNSLIFGFVPARLFS